MTATYPRQWRTGDMVQITTTYTARCDGAIETYPVRGLKQGEKFPPCRGGQEKAATFWVRD